MDGYAPWSVVWIAWRAMQAVSAQERLSMSRALSIGLASGAAAQAARDEELQTAYPPEMSEL